MESIWKQKPWWCQPWSILLTGMVGMIGSWLLLHRLWLSLPIAAVVLVWWWLFLIVVPATYQAQISADDGVNNRSAVSAEPESAETEL